MPTPPPPPAPLISLTHPFQSLTNPTPSQKFPKKTRKSISTTPITTTLILAKVCVVASSHRAISFCRVCKVGGRGGGGGGEERKDREGGRRAERGGEEGGEGRWGMVFGIGIFINTFVVSCLSFRFSSLMVPGFLSGGRRGRDVLGCGYCRFRDGGNERYGKW